jgi:hypothetical protein
MHSSWKSREGGHLSFGQILLRGVLGVIRKFSCFIPFLLPNFSEITPSFSSPPGPPCVHLCLWKTFQYHLYLIWQNPNTTILYSYVEQCIKCQSFCQCPTNISLLPNLFLRNVFLLIAISIFFTGFLFDCSRSIGSNTKQSIQ